MKLHHRIAVGPLLIAAAAFMWATDALFRMPSSQQVDSTLLVFWEHALVVALMTPWLLAQGRKAFQMSLSGWLSAAAIGVGASAIATVLFTQSFHYLNPSVTILLQKLQPLICVGLAASFLGEKPGKVFYLWSPIALVAAVILSFPDFDFRFLTDPKEKLHALGIACALGAAALWAGGTVVGKVLLGATHPTNATFWRFMFGLIGLYGILLINGTPVHFGFLTQPELRLPVIYISLVPGFFAMIAYYAGLRSTPASIATFLELLFPVASVVLNWLFLNEKLTGLQLGAGAVLLASVTFISSRRETIS